MDSKTSLAPFTRPCKQQTNKKRTVTFNIQIFNTTLNPDVRSSSSLTSTIAEGVAVIHTDEKIPKRIAIKVDVQSSPRNVIAS